jgi:hypothetical protein
LLSAIDETIMPAMPATQTPITTRRTATGDTTG